MTIAKGTKLARVLGDDVETWRFGLAAVLALLICFVASHTLAQAQGQAKLTLEQVRELIHIGAPDVTIAREIRSRGVQFQPTPKIIDDLKRAGAGQTTLAALREQMAVGAIEIQAPAGSQVAIDGADQGLTDQQGRLALSGVVAGDHQLVVRKAGYRDSEFKFTLGRNEQKTIPVQLEWAGGYLTVRANPVDASVEIAGLGSYKGGVSELRCPPGTYDVTLSRTGMKSETRSVLVAAGQHAVVEFHLAPDPQYLHDQLEEAKQRLAIGDPVATIRISNTLASLEPNNSDVQSLLAAAYLQVRDLGNFQKAAAEAIRNGGSVTLDLAHEHLGPSGEAIHPATLTLTAKSIAYDPKGSACKYPAFVSPLASIELIEVTNKSTSGFLVVRHLAAGTFLLHVDLRDPTKADRKMTLYFAVPNSSIQRQNNVGFLVSPSDSSQFLSIVADLIRSGMAASQEQ
jgi:hypothetical protein